MDMGPLPHTTPAQGKQNLPFSNDPRELGMQILTVKRQGRKRKQQQNLCYTIKVAKKEYLGAGVKAYISTTGETPP